jgi:hypothetical protein
MLFRARALELGQRTEHRSLVLRHILRSATPLLDRVFLYSVVSTLEAGIVVVVLTGIVFRVFAGV